MSISRYFGVEAAAHGFDDVGAAQPSGSYSGATSATKYGPRFAGKTKIVLGTAIFLKKGSPINIVSTVSGLNGPTRVLKVLAIPGATAATGIIINKVYATPTSATGTFNRLQGEGAWDAFEPMGSDISASDLVLTFWDPNQQGGDYSLSSHLQGQKYYFPGNIKTFQITTGNVRLFRSATLRPRGGTAQ